MRAASREAALEREEGVSPSDLDAHRQVLEMARALEVLQRDYELMQKELSAAYAQLRERSTARNSADSGYQAQGRAPRDGYSGDVSCSSHQREIDELTKLLEVKDVALTEALEQRNQHRVELEKAEALIRELRALHLEALGGRGTATKPAGSPSGGWYSSCVANATSVSRVHASFSASTLLGTASTAEVPHTERFDQESTYHRKENDALFWRKQYREAVRMRKKPSLANTALSASASRSSSATAAVKNDGKPSLKIFSAPNTQRQRVITDESIPFSRYIGISARQHEIIKEQHRILS